MRTFIAKLSASPEEGLSEDIGQLVEDLVRSPTTNCILTERRKRNGDRHFCASNQLGDIFFFC